MPGDITVFDWTTRLIIAALLSGMVGFEREARQKAAGLRTHMLVGLGAALFTLVGAYAFESADPTRVAAQVVTGVGFLGAGAIFRHGVTVRGLTTAAGLWAVAAIGITTGLGLVTGAVIATLIAVTILYGLGVIETMLRDRKTSGAMRSLGVQLKDFSELNKVVKLTCTLDEAARQTGIDPNGEGFVVTFAVSREKVGTITAALPGFETVTGVSELDPR